ncbi:MAG: GGDEF domain-containing protein [Pseudomonadota bacterium]
MLDMTRIEMTSRTAEFALSLARQHSLAPTPVIFEVLFKYATGAQADVAAEVEEALSKPEDVREDAITRIYDERLGPEALIRGLGTVRRSLSNEIADMSVQINDSLKGNLNLAQAMRESIRDLTAPITKDDVRTICKTISTTNKVHLASTQNMALQLERTQYQLTEMQRELTVLRKNASVDQLTGLNNRRYVQEKIANLVDAGTSTAIVMIDIDSFSVVNERWGFSAGDNILRRLGELLRTNTKGKDIAARVGGDEFVIVLPNTELNGAERLCMNICLEFANINWISQSTEEEIGMLTLSGSVTGLSTSDTYDTLHERLAALMTEAKDDGPSQVRLG